ncbi:MAG: hypothetical protein IT364_05180 [Candidatus Hydrogenedentes bacterium]|nr:hypothetical protein [Candidatus Hydrogenedentota bacterium]
MSGYAGVAPQTPAPAPSTLEPPGDTPAPPPDTETAMPAREPETLDLSVARLTEWPAPEKRAEAPVPLQYDKWAGPYMNAAGERWVNQINQWYTEGTAAGLTQDTFRSFDNDHSSIRTVFFPQLNVAEPVTSFGTSCKNVLGQRVTMGVQSYGTQGMCVADFHCVNTIRSFYESGKPAPGPQALFRIFYENNFVYVAPAVGTFAPDKDAFSFLSPFYLHSVGASGTDATLLKPLVFASAALPPDLKTRILRNGLFAPVMMYLFKNAIAGDIKSPDAHLPAYTLPEEAENAHPGPSPFLDTLISSAHGLKHVPPVCRMKATPVAPSSAEGKEVQLAGYMEDNTYAFSSALRPGEALELEVDLRPSWTDEGKHVTEYYAAVLRGKADIQSLESNGSRVKVTVPWEVRDRDRDFRTDILLLVSDGTYYSAPAYISVRHIHKLDPIIRGIRIK